MTADPHPTCVRLGHIGNLHCAYCGTPMPAPKVARQRLAALIHAFTPATAPARQRLHQRIGWLR